MTLICNPASPILGGVEVLTRHWCAPRELDGSGVPYQAAGVSTSGLESI